MEILKCNQYVCLLLVDIGPSTWWEPDQSRPEGLDAGSSRPGRREGPEPGAQLFGSLPTAFLCTLDLRVPEPLVRDRACLGRAQQETLGQSVFQ